MDVRVTVVVSSSHSEVHQALRSVGGQSLAPSDVQVVVVDDAASPELTALLSDIARHRTNMEICPLHDTTVLEASLPRARGTYLCLLPDGSVLESNALERLCAYADDVAADAVLGKTAVRSGVTPAAALFAGDQTRLTADRLGDVSGVGRVYRTAFLRALAEGGGLPADPLDQATSIAVLAHAPAFLGPGGAAARLETQPWSCELSAAGWDQGVLSIVCSLGATRDESGPTVPTRVHLRLSRRADGLEWWGREVTVTPTGSFTAEVDPERFGPAGAGLASGVWEMSVVTPSSYDASPVPVTSRTPLSLASVGRGVHVVATSDTRLLLDVGAAEHPVVRKVRMRDATVTEDARGSLLTAPLADVDIAGSGTVDGYVRAGGVPLKAWIDRAPDGRAVLHAWLSGLPGSRPLLTRFSGVGFTPTNARLVIADGGSMSLRPRRPRRPRTTPETGGSRQRQSARLRARRSIRFPVGAYRRARRLLSRRT